MVNMTLAVPKELHNMMKKHPEIKWSEIARRALREYAKKLEMLNKIAEESKLTKKDIEELDRIVKKAIMKHYGKNAE
jgi:hypothetical protein